MELAKLQDKQLEQHIIGTFIAYGSDVMHDYVTVINPDCFYTTLHKSIWTALVKIRERGDRTTIPLLTNELNAMQVRYDFADLSELVTSAFPTEMELPSSVKLLVDYSRRRKAAELAAMIEQSAMVGGEEFIHSLDTLREKLTDITTSGASDDVKTMYDSLKELYDYVNDMAAGKRTAGLPTGFSTIDQYGGFLFGDLVVIAAKSSVGKTSFALYLARAMAQAGNPGVIYSMEMNDLKLSARLASAESGISSNALLARPLSQEEMRKFDTALGKIANLPIYFDDKNRTNIDTITNSIRRLHAKQGIKWAIVDYLQILSTTSRHSDNEASKLAEYSRRLKSLATDLNIVIIALSQLRRDGEDKPRKDRIYGAAEIESASDSIIMLYRPTLNERSEKRYDPPYEDVDINTTCLIDIQKGRNTGIFQFMAGFDAEHTRFYELSELPRATVQPEENKQKQWDAPF